MCVWLQLVRSKPRLAQSFIVCWTRSLQLSIKLNTNAFVTLRGVVGGGWVRSHEGKLIFAYYKEFGEQNVIIVEAMSLLVGLTLH